MAEPGIQNWKEKYLTALEDFEASHKKDQQRLDILRRGLVRVSLAADGLDGPLDEQLAELRLCLRGNKDTLSLEPLIAQLERTVVALDDRRKQEQDALLSLLEKDLDLYLEMDLPRQDKSTIRKLRKDLPDLIASHGSHLTMWRQQLRTHGEAGLDAKQVGRKPVRDERDKAKLQRELALARKVIELAGKAHEILGVALPSLENDEKL